MWHTNSHTFHDASWTPLNLPTKKHKTIKTLTRLYHYCLNWQPPTPMPSPPCLKLQSRQFCLPVNVGFHTQDLKDMRVLR